ncbi:T9SS type A sorting domain-containing protein [Fluviicola taffensis]|uniref:T9SS type A sorting domain-containing protein n=1 Tax=Fluviicola taffensis TaxID=191579 RepID=UPI00313818E0
MRVLSIATMILLCFTSLAVNTPPALNLSQTFINPVLCSADDSEVQIFQPFEITDIDNDFIQIVGITSSNQSVIQDASLYAGSTSSTGTLSSYLYSSWGFSGAGSCIITLEVSDGTQTVFITLPTITVVETPTITILPNAQICSSEGTVDLNQFVTPAGGVFDYDGSVYPNAEFNMIDQGYISNDNIGINYTLSNGACTAYDFLYLDLFISPTVSVVTTPTSCGASTGTAIATAVGGAPVLSQSWSNGVTGTPSISGLAAGQYMYYFVDTNQCSTTAAFSIDPLGVSINETVTDVVCFSQANGGITISQTGLTTPVTYIWSSGHTGTAVTGLLAGTYTVYATDANNCMISKAITVTQPDKIMFQAGVNVGPTCGASDGEIEVWGLNGGIPPYTTTWSNGVTGDINSNLAFGIYSATVTDANNCMAVKPVYLSENNSADISGNVIPAGCGGNDGKILVDIWVPGVDPIQSIFWSNGATTEDLLNVPSANYVCTATVANTGCRAIKGWNIPVVKPLRQDLCIITVDSVTTTNLLVWEKVQPIGIDYYNVYRETSTQGEYVLIDTVNFSNISLFNDVIASPAERSWSYKLGAVNVCGEEGPLSIAHRTIHLDLLDLGNNSVKVNWNAYEGTSAFTDYIVWRYTTANGWEQAGTVSSSTLSFTDGVAYATPGLDYMVEFALTEWCSAEKAQDFNTVRSNRERGQFAAGQGVDGASSNSIGENYLNNIGIYPNPTSDKLTFVQEGNEQVTYNILSLSGQLMQTTQSSQTNTVLDLSPLNAGVYLVELKMNDIKITKRVVKL